MKETTFLIVIKRLEVQVYDAAVLSETSYSINITDSPIFSIPRSRMILDICYHPFGAGLGRGNETGALCF